MSKFWTSFKRKSKHGERCCSDVRSCFDCRIRRNWRDTGLMIGYVASVCRSQSEATDEMVLREPDYLFSGRRMAKDQNGRSRPSNWWFLQHLLFYDFSWHMHFPNDDSAERMEDDEMYSDFIFQHFSVPRSWLKHARRNDARKKEMERMWKLKHLSSVVKDGKPLCPMSGPTSAVTSQLETITLHYRIQRTYSVQVARAFLGAQR